METIYLVTQDACGFHATFAVEENGSFVPTGGLTGFGETPTLAIEAVEYLAEVQVVSAERGW